MTKEQLKDFQSWINDGNAFETRQGVWVEQTTQWRKEFTLASLKAFFTNEYLNN